MYSIDSAKRIFQAFCTEEWIQERYLPSQIIAHRQERLDTVKDQHQLFCQLVATGEVLSHKANPSSNLSYLDFSRRIQDDVYPNCMYHLVSLLIIV